MRFVTFKDKNNKTIYVNPAVVSVVLPAGSSMAEIYFTGDRDDHVVVKVSAKTTAQRLRNNERR